MNISVVGYGYWGKNLVRNFDDLGMLYAVCDWDHSRREIAAQKYPDARFYSEYDEVLADAAVDAVVLATPAVSHFEMARQAFQAGKDLYVEKPLAMNVQEGRELQEMAEENDCILMVGHILRYHPAVMKLEELVRQGALGQVRYLYSNRLNMGKIRTEENILWSFAPHDISVMLAISGEEPSRVSCGGGSYVSEDVADVTVSQFVFPGGLRAHIYVSWLHPFKEQRLVVIGSEKMAVFDDTAEQKLVLYPHKVEWKDHLPSAVKAEGEVVAIDDGEPLRRECQHFIDCVENHTTPRTDATESIRVLKVLDACQRSLKLLS
ncbi:MAG: Gfo/Idh/MocA family oxidoreductase, partial [Planctomycetes bacterium]|nr:Gfo/Idh/MocA family oxidoreductase [Planctomycetota bacterium]